MTKDKEEKFGKKETQKRFEAALRGGLKTPPQPLKAVSKKRKDKAPKRG